MRRAEANSCAEAVTARFKTFRHVKPPKAPQKERKKTVAQLHFEHQEKSLTSRSDASKLYQIKSTRIPLFPIWGQQFQFHVLSNITAELNRAPHTHTHKHSHTYSVYCYL